MNIEDLSIFGLYSQKENKVTAALLQVLEFGGASLLCSILNELGGNFSMLCHRMYRKPTCARRNWFYT